LQDRREKYVGVEVLRMSRLPKRCCDALRKGGASAPPESAPQHLQQLILQGMGAAAELPPFAPSSGLWAKAVAVLPHSTAPKVGAGHGESDLC